MPGSADTFIDLLQGLEGIVKKATKELSGFNDVSQKVNSSFIQTNKELKTTDDVSKKVNDTFDDINNSKEKIRDNTQKWNSALNVVKANAKAIIGIFAAGIGTLGFVDAIKGALNLHQNMMDLSYQMGEGAAGAKYLESSIMDITASTGLALEKVQGMTTALMEMKVPIGMVKQLSTDSLRFSEITGASEESVAQMTAGLVRMGGLGQKSISNMLGNMVQVQRAFGLSRTEMTHLSNKITDTTMILRNMGKSAIEIEKFQKGTMQLAGAFASVGIKAEEATKIIDRLLDPGELENNALLYSKLGISIQDAMEGNINPEDIAQGLQGIGAELQDMSGPQANALAKALGVPLQQLRQMGNMDMTQIQETFGGLTGSSESLASAQEDQATTQRDLAQMWEKVKGTIGEIALKLMPVFDAVANALNDNMGNILGWVRGIINAGFIEKFIDKIAVGIKVAGSVLSSITSGIDKFFSKLDPKILLLGLAALISGIFLFKKKFASFGTDSATEVVKGFRSASNEIGEEIASGISSGLEMASEKGSRVFAAKMQMSSRIVADDVQKRISEGHQSAALSAAADYQRILAGENTFGWAKKMNESSAEWLDTISAGGKPLSMLASYYRNSQAALREKMEMSQVDYRNEADHLVGMRKEQGQYISQLYDRFKTLEDIRKNGTITAEQSWELNKIEKEIIRTKDAHSKTQKEINDLQKAAQDASAAYVNKLGPDELALYREQLETKKNEILEKQNSYKQTIDNLSIEEEILKAAEKSLRTEKDSLESKIKAGDATADDVENYNKIRTALIDNAKSQKEVTSGIQEAQTSSKDLTGELQNVNQSLEQAAQRSKEIGPGDPDRMFTSFGKNLSDAANGAMGIIASKFTDVREKFSKSLHAAGQSIKQSVDPKNWIAAIRTAGDGNLFRGILKMGTGAAKAMAHGISSAGKAVAKMFGGAGKALAVGGALLAGAFLKSDKGKEVMEKVQAKIADAMEKLSPVISELMDTLVPVIMNVVDSLMPVISGLITDFVPTITELIKNLLPTIMGLLDAVLPIVIDLIEKLLPVVMSLVEAIMPIIMGLIDSLMPVFNILLGLIIDLAKKLLPAIMPLISIMLGFLAPLIKLLLPPLIRILGFLFDILGTVVTAIGKMISGLGNFIPGLKSVGDSIQNVGKGMQDAAASMSESANKMAGAVVRVARVWDLQRQQEIIHFRSREDANALSDSLSKKLGVSNETIQKSSAQDLVVHLKDKNAKEEMVKALVDNTLALGDSVRTLRTQEVRSQIESEAEVLRNKGQTLASAMSNAMAALKSGYDVSKNVNVQTLQKSVAEGGYGARLDGTVIQNATAVFENMMKSIGIGNDSIIYQEYANQIKGTASQQTEALMSIMTQIDSLKTGGLFGIGSGAGEKNVEDLVESALEGQESVITGEVLSTLRRNTIDQFAAASGFTGDINTGTMAETNATIESMARTMPTELAAEFRSLMRDLNTATDETDYAKKLEENIRRSDGLLSNLAAGMFSIAEHGTPYQRRTEELLEDVAGNTSPAGEGETVTKLYPAIVDAASSGFVKTQDAEARTSGSTPEERTAASTELQARNLEIMLQGQGLQTDAIQTLVEEFRKMREAQVAANATR